MKGILFMARIFHIADLQGIHEVILRSGWFALKSPATSQGLSHVMLQRKQRTKTKFRTFIFVSGYGFYKSKHNVDKAHLLSEFVSAQITKPFLGTKPKPP